MSSVPPALANTPANLVVVQSLGTATVGVIAVRFYLSPSDTPEMPWVSLVNIMNVATPEVGAMRSFRGRIDGALVLARDENTRVAIIPYWLGSEMLRSAIGAGNCDRAARDEYQSGAELALRGVVLRQPEGKRAAYRKEVQERLRKQMDGE